MISQLFILLSLFTLHAFCQCESNPCANGLCRDLTTGGYFCICDPGFTGPICDNNDCFGDPCINGDCIDGDGDFSCLCLPGWDGFYCDQDVDPCDPNPCINGECQIPDPHKKRSDEFICVCEVGFMGDLCETPLDPCQGVECNHGVCVEVAAGQVVCDCEDGYVGIDCNIDIDECFSSPCEHGICEDKVNDYECICDPGFIGKNCDTDPCDEVDCNHGTCVLGPLCDCNFGYEGLFCDTLTDTDGDGVGDLNDKCPNTVAGSTVNSDGCSQIQICPCDNTKFKTHGKYVDCVKKWVDINITDAALKLQLKIEAAESDCGKQLHK